jgi:hypothetical protein
MSTNDSGSTIATDTSGSSAVNENTAITSTNGYRQIRNTPWGKVETIQEPPLSIEHVVDESDKTNTALREQLWQKDRAKGESPTYTVNKLLGELGTTRRLRGEITGYVNLMMSECVQPHRIRIEGDPQYRKEFQRWAEEGQLDSLLAEIYRLNSKMRELLQLAQTIETIKDYAAKQKRLGQIYRQIKDNAR